MRNFLILALLATVPAASQLSKSANEGYRTVEGRARVARNLDSSDREERQKPRELVASIGLSAGDVIADVGSGVGFMIPYFLEVIGPSGKLYAEDIQQDFLDRVEEKKEDNNWTNVETILGGQVDPKLPPETLDLAFILDAYHHFEQPVETIRRIRESLKPDGRLVMVDFYRSRKHPTMADERLKSHIRKDRDGFADEIKQAGFKLERQFDHLPHQYALIFVKAEAGD